ncbi:MAG: hypothetical protein CR994_02995 [Maribacter sp.]|nr:MAG: hypothetical protein CR994_02995 [Maribacter sp.]
MNKEHIQVVESSGEMAGFPITEYRNSLYRSGADGQMPNTVQDGLYQGISTEQIYNRAFAL